jgi:hypothetical protein
MLAYSDTPVSPGGVELLSVAPGDQGRGALIVGAHTDSSSLSLEPTSSAPASASAAGGLLAAPDAQGDDEQGSGVGGSTLNFVNSIVGSGIIGFPYAFRLACE